MSITGGVSWEEVLVPLYTISYAWVVIYVFYISFTYFVPWIQLEKYRSLVDHCCRFSPLYLLWHPGFPWQDLRMACLLDRSLCLNQGSAQCCHQAAEGSMFRCKQTISSSFSLRLQIWILHISIYSDISTLDFSDMKSMEVQPWKIIWGQSERILKVSEGDEGLDYGFMQCELQICLQLCLTYLFVLEGLRPLNSLAGAFVV